MSTLSVILEDKNDEHVVAVEDENNEHTMAMEDENEEYTLNTIGKHIINIAPPKQ